MASTLAPRKPRWANAVAAASRSARLVSACRSARVRRRFGALVFTYDNVSGYHDVYGRRRGGGSPGPGVVCNARRPDLVDAARGHRALGGRPGAVDVDHRAPPVGDAGKDGAL